MNWERLAELLPDAWFTAHPTPPARGLARSPHQSSVLRGRIRQGHLPDGLPDGEQRAGVGGVQVRLRACGSTTGRWVQDVPGHGERDAIDRLTGGDVERLPVGPSERQISGQVLRDRDAPE